jgi:glutathione S-transferase
VQRATLCFAAKQIPFQYVHVNLQEKAQWHLDVNGGFIPLLENPDGTIVNESAVLMDFAHSFAAPSQGIKLWPHDGAAVGDIAANFKTAQMKLEMTKLDKHGGKFWGAFLSRFVDEEKLNAFIEVLPEYEALVTRNLNGSDWLSGESEPMVIDFHYFPLLERLIMFEDSPFQYAFDALKLKETCPNMYAYVHRFRAHPLLKDHVMPAAAYNKLLLKFIEYNGPKPPLDIEMLKI